MTYVSPQQTDDLASDPTSNTTYSESFSLSLVMAARGIYSNYCKTHSEKSRRPVVGVVIHQETGRGQLVFQGKPVLLPKEHFVPFEQISSAELD